MRDDEDRDEFETTPTKTAIDAREEVLRRQQRAQEELVATNRKALRELRRAAEDDDRPSVITEVHNHFQIPKASRRPPDEHPLSIPAGSNRVSKTFWSLLRSLPKEQRHTVVSAILLIGATVAVVTIAAVVAILVIRGQLSIGSLLGM